MSLNFNKHSVFVLDKQNKRLTPTTAAKARKLIKAGVAIKTFSKFNTFGIILLTDSRKEIEEATLGYDVGTKFEGFSIVVGKENLLNVKLDLPDKKQIVRKLEERRTLRKGRRGRKCRRRPARFKNRSRKRFIAPSQLVVVQSRLRILKELVRIYPIKSAGIEDVKFNHAKNRWGKNFSTCEIGKSLIRKFFNHLNIKLYEFAGYETKQIREKYGYKKSSKKGEDVFSSHCSDSLSLALEVSLGEKVEVGKFLVVDDTYRCVRRKLHDTQPTKGGKRAEYSKGTVIKITKGRLLGFEKGKIGRICGRTGEYYFYHDGEGKRKTGKEVRFISTQFIMKKGGCVSTGPLVAESPRYLRYMKTHKDQKARDIKTFNLSRERLRNKQANLMTYLKEHLPNLETRKMYYLMYLADFMHCQQVNYPITYLQYYNKNGFPIPLVADLRLVDNEYYKEYLSTWTDIDQVPHIVDWKGFDNSHFSKRGMGILDEIVKCFACNHITIYEMLKDNTDKHFLGRNTPLMQTVSEIYTDYKLIDYRLVFSSEIANEKEWDIDEFNSHWHMHKMFSSKYEGML